MGAAATAGTPPPSALRGIHMGTRRNQIKEFGATGTVSALSGSGRMEHRPPLTVPLPPEGRRGASRGGGFSGSSTALAGARGAEAWYRL